MRSGLLNYRSGLFNYLSRPFNRRSGLYNQRSGLYNQRSGLFKNASGLLKRVLTNTLQIFILDAHFAHWRMLGSCALNLPQLRTFIDTGKPYVFKKTFSGSC